MNRIRTAPRPSRFPQTAQGMISDSSLERMARAPDEGLGSLPSDGGFVAMRAAYRGTGGVARGDDLARLLEDRGRGGSASLAGLIDGGAVFGFDWRRDFWIPMFQFELRDLSLKTAPHEVLAELAAEFDGWNLAAWFAQRNSWLNERRPVDVLDANLPAVLAAARADRFIAAG